jgi:hypothetical protein
MNFHWSDPVGSDRCPHELQLRGIRPAAPFSSAALQGIGWALMRSLRQQAWQVISSTTIGLPRNTLLQQRHSSYRVAQQVALMAATFT